MDLYPDTDPSCGLSVLDALEFVQALIEEFTHEEVDLFCRDLSPLKNIGITWELVEGLTKPSPKNNLREDLLDILPRTNAPSRPASTVDRRRNTKTFHPFPRLPKELQQKVWSYTFPSDRRFPLEIFMRFWDGPLWPFRGAPAPYSMDKAGYEFSLKHYHDIWAWIPTSGIPYQRCMKPYFFNVKKDYFTLNLATLVRIGNRPMEIYSHDSVKWCLENNPNREIIEQADILEIQEVSRCWFKLGDRASEALNILSYFPNLKELRLCDVPRLDDHCHWREHHKTLCFQLTYLFAVLKDRGKLKARPKITIHGTELFELEEHYEGALKELAKKKPLQLKWERKDSMLMEAD